MERITFGAFKALGCRAAALAFFFSIFAASPRAGAQTPAPAAPATPAPAASTNGVPALPPPTPEVMKKMQEILDAYGHSKYDDALAKLAEVEKGRPNDVELLNLRGAIYVKQQKWAEATEEFNKVLQLNPKYFPARFNLGEVPNLQKKYPEARAIFQTLLAEDPRNELLQYKIYLTYLLEGNVTEAKTWLDKFDFTGNTPAYYYAQAAWSYSKKNVPEAESYIASAVQIFPVQSNNLFAEPLIDAGWLKRRAPEAAK